MEPDQNQNEMDLEPEDLDFQIPGLFHKSSLKERTDPELPIISIETDNIKRTYDEFNNTKINQYAQLDEIGRGAFGVVLKVQDENKKLFAMKTYSTLGLKNQRFFTPDGQFANAMEMLENELNIVKRVNHLNIANCHQILYDGNKIYLVMQLAHFGQIMNWSSLKENYERNQQAYKYLSQKYKTDSLVTITKIVFLQVFKAIFYLHQNDITNRDIKVDNILCCESQDLATQIKITDFTTARYSKDDISYFVTGTPGFRGPEIQYGSSDGYSCKALDVWSAGISMYVYFHENLPFYAQSQLQIDIKANKQPLIFNEACPEWMKDIINKMTCKDWKQRINMETALKLLMQSQQ